MSHTFLVFLYVPLGTLLQHCTEDSGFCKELVSLPFLSVASSVSWVWKASVVWNILQL